QLLDADLEQQGGGGAEERRSRNRYALLLLFSLAPRLPSLLLHPGVAQRLALFDVLDRHLFGQVTHTGEVARALGDADGAARVEQVKCVRTVQDVVMCGGYQPTLQ